MPLNTTLKQLLPTPLHSLCETGPYAAGAALFLQGASPQWMFFVQEGEVVLERHAIAGDAACLQRCQGGFVAEASLTAARYHCDARASQASTVTRVPVLAIRQALRTDAAFAERWITMLSSEVRKLRLQNERLSLPRVQDRIQHLIETEGQQGHYALDCPLKQLARQLAVSHEALYRALAQMEKAGRLRRTDFSLTLQKNFPPPAVEAPVDKQAENAPKPRRH